MVTIDLKKVSRKMRDKEKEEKDINDCYKSSAIPSVWQVREVIFCDCYIAFAVD